MTPDNINAIGMILMVVVTFIAIYFFRTKPIKAITWKVKVSTAVVGAVLTLLLWTYAIPIKMCIEIPEPFGQFELTALCVMGLILFIDKKAVTAVACVSIIYAGIQLQIQFNELVHYSNNYATIDANTHRPMAKGCSEKSAEGMVIEGLWHTWFTGIYKLK
jgi:hypothetical protein